MCMASPNIYESVCQLTEHTITIDITHSKSASGDSFATAADSVAGSGSIRYELKEAYITSQNDDVHHGETITIECGSLTKSYNPPLKSTDRKTSFGYDFKMLKPI